MNAQNMAQMAYSSAATPIRTYRGTEAEIFSKTTTSLKQAAAQGPAGFGALAQAILNNRRLWTVLAADVADDENPLPDELRAGVLSLAEFTNQHSSKVLSGESSVDILIEINTALMRGLRGV